MAIQETIALACSVQTKDSDMETEDTLAQFESAAELLMKNVNCATESIRDCFNFIRDPKEGPIWDSLMTTWHFRCQNCE